MSANTTAMPEVLRVVALPLVDDPESNTRYELRRRATLAEIEDAVVDFQRYNIAVTPSTRLSEVLAKVERDRDEHGVFAVGFVGASAGYCDYYSALNTVVVDDGSLRWGIHFDDPELTIGAVANSMSEGLVKGGLDLVVVDPNYVGMEGDEYTWYEYMMMLYGVLHALGDAWQIREAVFGFPGDLRRVAKCVSNMWETWEAWGAEPFAVYEHIQTKTAWEPQLLATRFRIPTEDASAFLRLAGYEDRDGIFHVCAEENLTEEQLRVRRVLAGYDEFDVLRWD